MIVLNNLWDFPCVSQDRLKHAETFLRNETSFSRDPKFSSAHSGHHKHEKITFNPETIISDNYSRHEAVKPRIIRDNVLLKLNYLQM
jgi:hypothetical protein